MIMDEFVKKLEEDVSILVTFSGTEDYPRGYVEGVRDTLRMARRWAKEQADA